MNARGPGRRSKGGVRAPGFSVAYMDRSVPPGADFYRFAVGAWIKGNPVPPDKSRWGAFEELVEYNYARLHRIVERAARPPGSHLHAVAQEVSRFYASAMDTAGRDRLGFTPLERDLKRIDAVRSLDDLVDLLADFHGKGIPAFFSTTVYPDKKRSRVYAFYLQQGGLSLPDREYYLAKNFAPQRKAFEQHVVRVFSLMGESPGGARRC